MKQIDTGGAVFYTDPITVDVLTSVAEEKPLEFALYQNYPNPFNPSTTISYQLPSLGHVTLRVLDVLGREVATLVNEMKKRGTYAVRFDASGLPSGVYVARLQSVNMQNVKKLVLIR